MGYHTFTKLHVHLVFATRDREPWFTDRELRTRLFAYLAETARRSKCVPLKVGGWIEHVHLLVDLAATSSVADLARDVKANSSRWLRRLQPTLANFAWQEGYGAFAVGQSQVAVTRRYIERQEEHHCVETFAEEYEKFLRVHGLQVVRDREGDEQQ